MVPVRAAPVLASTWKERLSVAVEAVCVIQPASMLTCGTPLVVTVRSKVCSWSSILMVEGSTLSTSAADWVTCTLRDRLPAVTVSVALRSCASGLAATDMLTV